MLNEIEVSADNLHFGSQEGVLFNKDGFDLIYYPHGKENNYTIPQGVISIHDCAFYWCQSLTTIVIPDTLTSIGVSAFDWCRNLSTVTMGSNVSNISASAFAYCDNLSTMTIPESVSIIGNGAFQSCRSLTEINVDENNKLYMDLDGILFNYEQTELIQYPAGRGASGYSIPQGVTSIVDRAFSKCDYLNSVSLPDSVGYIDDYAFDYCVTLSSVFCEGYPPETGWSIFLNCRKLATVYYIEGTPGWENTFAGKPTTPYPYTFTINNDEITITGYSDPELSVSISSEISGYPVTAIADTAFYGCTNLVRVSIPDSVMSIGFASFSGCSSLETVTLGTSVSEIKNWAFYDCSNLVRVYAKGNAPDYGASIFEDSPVTIYYMPGQTGWIDTFADCPVVFLPYTYTILNDEVRIDSYLGDSGISNTVGHAEVEIPSSIEGYPVTEIGESAFEDCNTIVSVVIPDRVNIIGEAAFCNCQMLTDITFKTPPYWYWNDRSIGAWAFAGCDSLSSLIMPRFDTIGDFAFAFCSSLTEIYFSSYSPPAIGDDLFAYTPVTIFAASSDWGNTFAGAPVQQMLYSYYLYDGSVVITGYRGNEINLSIPSTIANKPVIAISDTAFLRNVTITDITLPSSVVHIDENAFESCTALTNVILSANLEEICRGTFFLCSNLQSVMIPDSVSSIGDDAFFLCTNLTSVSISCTVTNIGESAFRSCTGLTNINVDTENSYYSSQDGVLFDKTQSNLIQFPGGKEGAYTIPPNVDTISDSAFHNCVGLTSVLVRSSVSSIGNGAFGACPVLLRIDVSADNIFYSSLDGVLFNEEQTRLIAFPGGKNGTYYIPDGITVIGDSAFTFCWNLTNVVISSTVRSIGSASFTGCQDFTTIIIPNNVTNIGDWAFCECTNLDTVVFQGNPPELIDYYGEVDPWAELFVNTPATIYYLPESSGWGVNFAGRPTTCWNPSIQQNGDFGLNSGIFGFNVKGNANIPIKIEATDNLSSENWTPLIDTSIDETGNLDFVDHESLNKPKQFYRIVFP